MLVTEPNHVELVVSVVPTMVVPVDDTTARTVVNGARALDDSAIANGSVQGFSGSDLFGVPCAVIRARNLPLFALRVPGFPLDDYLARAEAAMASTGDAATSAADVAQQ